MKKSVLILSTVLVLGLLSSKARAQNIGYGIRGGVNFSKITQANFDSGNRTGLMLGLYFDSPIYDNLIIFEPEVLYTQKGFEYRNGDYRIDYIEIPLKFRVNFVNPSGILPYVYFGPYIAFKVNTSFPDFQTIFREKNVKTTDLGVTVGGGLDFGHFMVGVRYDAGLTKTFEDLDAKNGVFSVTAGIGL